MGDISGSIRKLTLNGVTYDVMHDANINEIGSGYENTAIPTSGRNIRKMAKRVQLRESVIVAANGNERDALHALADGGADFPMAYTTAAGDVYHATGFIEFVKRETEENRAELKLIPRTKWESFLKS